MSVTTPDSSLQTGVRTYTVDPAHSSVSFSIRHLMIAHVRGTLSGLSGTLSYDPARREASSVDIVIDANTFGTGTPDRDTHVKSADFLDVAKYPTISFRSTAVRPNAGDAGEIDGDLTIKGVTRPVTVAIDEESAEINDAWGNLRVAFAAHGKIKRSDFGVNWNAPIATGGVMLGDDIKIDIDVQFVRKP